MIDPASVGPAGRAVRCARCKATWFVSPSKPAGPPSVSAFVDSVIAEAEADAKGAKNPASQQPFGETFGTAASQADGNLPHVEPPSLAPEPAFAQETPSFDSEHTEQAVDRRQDLTAAGPETMEPVRITDAPPLAPPHDSPYDDSPYGTDGGNEFFSGPPLNEPDDGANFAARRARLKDKRKKYSRNSRWIALALVLFAINVALLGARSEIVRYLPQTASLFSAIGLPVNLRNLEFENIVISKETQDGVNILIIEGKVVNTSRKAVDVPRLRFAARTAAGQEVYTWTMQPARSILGPGDSMPFTSRLAAPPANAADILVRFFTPQDAGGALK